MTVSNHQAHQHRSRVFNQQLLSMGWAVLDWVFPPECLHCQTPGYELCPACLESIQLVKGRLCPTCGIPHLDYANCYFCRQDPPAFDALRSWAVYGDVSRAMIHALKYERRLSAALPMGRLLAEFFQGLRWEVDMVVPVPIPPQRERQRGYNQAAAIARVFQRFTGIPLKRNVLGRVKYTPSQVGLSVKDRKLNVQGAFWAVARKVHQKRVLVIDDVCTSGATLRACAAALKKAGAAAVFCLTVARAGFYMEGNQLQLVDDLPEMDTVFA